MMPAIRDARLRELLVRSIRDRASDWRTSEIDALRYASYNDERGDGPDPQWLRMSREARLRAGTLEQLANDLEDAARAAEREVLRG